MLIPGQTVPPLEVPTIAGQDFDIKTSQPEHFTMLVFYRGLHCPLCRKYLTDLAAVQADYESKGVSIVVLSVDTKDRSEEMISITGGSRLQWAYNLPLSTAREWGLYLSASKGETAIGVEEPRVFSEPGVFLVRPDQKLYYVSVQSMPFARPAFKELLFGIDYVTSKDYPERGDYTGAV